MKKVYDTNIFKIHYKIIDNQINDQTVPKKLDVMVPTRSMSWNKSTSIKVCKATQFIKKYGFNILLNFKMFDTLTKGYMQRLIVFDTSKWF